jgi:hypothetical protein
LINKEKMMQQEPRQECEDLPRELDGRLSLQRQGMGNTLRSVAPKYAGL